MNDARIQPVSYVKMYFWITYKTMFSFYPS